MTTRSESVGAVSVGVHVGVPHCVGGTKLAGLLLVSCVLLLLLRLPLFLLADVLIWSFYCRCAFFVFMASWRGRDRGVAVFDVYFLPLCAHRSHRSHRMRASDVAASRPNDKVLDESLAPILDAFKASYGGDQEDDVPAAGAKRSAGSSVRERERERFSPFV